MNTRAEIIEAKKRYIEEILDKWKFEKHSILRDKMRSQIVKWIDNFAVPEIEDAILLLSKIQYKDNQLIRKTISNLAKEIKIYFKDGLSKVNFFPIDEYPSSSGSMYLYTFKKELALPEDNFPRTQLGYNLPETLALVFFDDFIGSGNQAIKFYSQYLIDVSVDVYLVSLFAFTEGLVKIRSVAGYKKVFCFNILSNEDKAFHNESKVFKDGGTRTRIKSLCEKYGKILVPKYPLGYCDMQTLLVFPQYIPNSTLPIIWGGNVPQVVWFPLFERHRRKSPITKDIFEDSVENEIDEKVQVFISYAREDSIFANKLYDSLKSVSSIAPWIDYENILPGMDWEHEIHYTIQNSEFVIVLLSNNSVNKEGYVQKEIKEVLDRLAYYPPGKIYLIPARIDNCIPKYREFEKISWVDLFPDWDQGFRKIRKAIFHSKKKINKNFGIIKCVVSAFITN